MLPTLWPGDVVEIETCSIDEARRDDIVLAQRDGRLFLHRFIARRQGAFLLRGDSVPAPDPQFHNEAFLGRLISRAGPEPLFPPSLWSRAAGKMLCHCGPVRSLALKLHARRMQSAIKPTVPEQKMPDLKSVKIAALDPTPS